MLTLKKLLTESVSFWRGGMGLCKFASRAYDEALVLFESTLEINPHIKSIQRYSKELLKGAGQSSSRETKLTDALKITKGL